MSQKNPKAKRELEFEDGYQRRESGQNRERGYNGQQRRGSRPSHYNGREEASRRYKIVEKNREDGNNGEGGNNELEKRQMEADKEKRGSAQLRVPTDEGSSNTGLAKRKQDGTKGKEGNGQIGVQPRGNGESDELMLEREEGELGDEGGENVDLLGVEDVEEVGISLGRKEEKSWRRMGMMGMMRMWKRSVWKKN